MLRRFPLIFKNTHNIVRVVPSVRHYYYDNHNRNDKRTDTLFDEKRDDQLPYYSSESYNNNNDGKGNGNNANHSLTASNTGSNNNQNLSVVKIDNLGENLKIVGLQDYMKKVSKTTGLLLGTAAATGGTSVLVAPMLASYPMVLGSVYLGAMGGALYEAFTLDKALTDKDKLKKSLRLHACMGIVISPSLFVYSQYIPHAAVTTSALVFGPAVASLHLPKGNLLRYGPALYTGLCGLVGVGFMGLGAHLLGFNDVGALLHSVDLYAGIGLFTVYNAYDTHVMIDEYEAGQANHVSHATNYSLNALNIFIRLLELFGKKDQK